MIRKKEIISKIHHKTGYSAKDIGKVLDAFSGVVLESLIEDDGFRLKWFGIDIQVREPKQFKNVRNGKIETVPRRRKPVLRISRDYEKAIKFRDRLLLKETKGKSAE